MRLPRLTVHTMLKNNVRSFSAAASSDIVLLNETDTAGVITLNRPKALNAATLEMVEKVFAPLKKWQDTKSVVIVKGAGGKAFCAGGDVRSLVEKKDVANGQHFFRTEYTLNYLVGTYRVPYVALIDGIVMGGGVGLSVHGTYRVATERTLLAMPETIIGLFPDVGGSHFLPKLQGKLGLYLGLTGFNLKGSDVLKAGIATHYCDSSKLPELEAELVANKNPNNIPSILDSFSAPVTTEFVLQKHLKQINECFGAPTVEGIFKNLEKDNSEWAQATIKTLRAVSPISLKVTHRGITLGGQYNSLAKSLQMEFRLVSRHLEDSDFAEGVRALLIDKDKKPKWNPKTVEEVTDERVQWFFSPLPAKDELILEPQSKL